MLITLSEAERSAFCDLHTVETGPERDRAVSSLLGPVLQFTVTRPADQPIGALTASERRVLTGVGGRAVRSPGRLEPDRRSFLHVGGLLIMTRLFWVLVQTAILGSALVACTAEGTSPSPSPSSAQTIPTQRSPVTVEVASRIPIADSLSDMVVDPDNELYISYEGTVSIVDIGQAESGQFPQTEISVGQDSGALALDSKHGVLYVATENSRGVGMISIIDLDTRLVPKVIDRVVLSQGKQPDDLALDPVTGSLFVLGSGSTLSVIDIQSRKVTGFVPVGYRDSGKHWNPPLGLDVDSKAGIAIVSGTARSWIIDTKSLDVVHIDTGGGGPVTVDSTAGHAFIPNEADGTVTVVDTTTRKVDKTITVGGHSAFGAVAIDATAGLAYVPVPGAGGGALAVIDTNTLEVVETIPRPAGEYYWGGLAVDSSTGSLYVGTAGSVLVLAKR